MNTKDIKYMSEKGAKEYLKRLIEALDNEVDDQLGTEGWRHYLGFGD